MRIKTLAVLMLFVCCNKKTNFDSTELIGNWKLSNVKDYDGQQVSDKVIFLENDSLIVELYSKDKLVQKIKGTYRFDIKNKLLTTAYQNQAFKFEVLELNSKHMKLQHQTSKIIDHYSRYE